MSLVYEALQKAEREKERKTGPSPIAPVAGQSQPVKIAIAAPVSPPIAPKSGSRSYLSFFIVGLSVVGVAALAYVIVVATKNIPQSRDAVGESRSSATAPSAAVTEPAPRKETPPPVASTENDSHFKLTGIMKMGDSYGAVINGRVVYQDTYVDGAIVKKVERDRAILNFNGQEIVLRLF